MKIPKFVACMNVGGYTPRNVQDSHLDAAARWGAHYLQITEPWDDMLGSSDPMTQLWASKMALHRLPVPAHSRVLMIDGDAVVRADCPSPFDLVPHNTIGAVRNPEVPECRQSAKQAWDEYTGRAGIRVPFDYSRYVNGGFLVFTPGIHAAVWEFGFSLAMVSGVMGGLVEQTFLNVALQALTADMTYLPQGFNYIGPAAWHGDQMEEYVYHLAPTSLDGERDKRARLESIDWRGVLCPN